MDRRGFIAGGVAALLTAFGAGWLVRERDGLEVAAVPDAPASSPISPAPSTPVPSLPTPTEPSTPDPIETAPDPVETEPPPVVAELAAMGLLCRAAWGAAAPTGPYVTHTVTGMMIHHTAVVLGDNRKAPARLRQHQAYHQDNGWPDIAYHLGVDRGGNAYELRPPDTRGDTFTEYDPTGWLLVVCEGDFDQEAPTPAQLETVAQLFAWGAGRFGVSPDTLAAHRDHASTSCPGDNLYAQVGAVRARVVELLAAGGVELTLVCGPEGQDRVAGVESTEV